MATWQDFNGLSLITDPYKRSVAQSLLINELGPVSNGYQIINAVTGKSGWSFGGQQMDLSKSDEGLKLLKDIVLYYDASYWTPELEAGLKMANNVKSITAEQRANIDLALKSDYGKSKIDANFVTAIDSITKYVDKIEIELQKINPNLELSSGEKLMLIDFKNQYGFSLDNTVSNSMLKKLQDEVARSGDLTPESIKELFKTTTYYENNKETQGIRINNTYNAALSLDSSGIVDMETYTKVTADQFQLSADYFKTTLEDLLKANPDLDLEGGYTLLKEGEKLYLPDDTSFDHTSTNPYDFNLTNSYFFQRCEPLALDTNKDGFIATTSVTESETYFDLTGDGIKERTGWIKGEDALLVYDANEDGQIGGISEVFGNATTEGFDELRDTIDSNYDNKIDRKDILFNRLQLWHDYDQDGSVDEGELKSLKEEGITSIDLNSVQTSINTNGNVITEASHYTTTTGEKELIADVHLQYDARDTIIDLVQQEDFTIDPTTLNLPNLRGYGLVVDSFMAYQTLFTCKPFSIQKALHVKIQNTPKGAKSGEETKVA